MSPECQWCGKPIDDDRDFCSPRCERAWEKQVASSTLAEAVARIADKDHYSTLYGDEGP